MKKLFKFIDTPLIIAVLFAFTASMAFAKDYVIYSIAQDIPMGTPNETIRKNFYVDMGKNQGIRKDSVLDVFRIVSVLDPYGGKKRFNHKIKVGELKILHSEETTSIGVLNKMEELEETPVLEVNALMIGDLVNVHVK
ncbi:MAG: hypothetical protein L6Q33_03275 [Bacteriovoracaceae bacterium]|jgi:hypothetical protein|nr:hypothetical protein [Bacteriovoracaceae bacterium]